MIYLIVKRRYMKAILLILSLLIIMPVSAAPQVKYKGGVPSLNVNTGNKKPQTKRTETEQKRIARSAAAAYSSQRNHAASPALATPQLQPMNYKRQSVTPTYPTAASFDMQPMTSVNGQVLSFFTSGRSRQGGTADVVFSGGVAADGLMSSGSRYASTTGEGGSASISSTTPSGPRKTNGYPDIPFPDEPVPAGDALIPFALLTLAYTLFALLRKRRASEC